LRGVSFSDVNNGRAVGFRGTILRTTNSGTTWITQTTSVTTNWLYGVSFSDANNGCTVGDSGTILYTTNGGTTWTTQTSGTTNTLYGISFIDVNNGVAVGLKGTILNTTNGGETWTTQKSGTTNILEGVYFSDANNGTAVGLNGTILHTTNGGVTFIEEHQIYEIPTQFLLSNNWPNPFNPSTRITYTIPKRSDVSIKVFNLLGSEVTELVKSEMEAGGYDIEFNASNLPSGVYFYRIQAGNFIDTKKMILLK